MISFRYLKNTHSSKWVNIFIRFYLYYRVARRLICIISFVQLYIRTFFIKHLVLVSFLVLMRLVLNWYFFPSLSFSLSSFLFLFHSVSHYTYIFTLLFCFFFITTLLLVYEYEPRRSRFASIRADLELR